VDDLAGKVAVITGAAKGLGFALATVLAGEGMRLVLADIDASGLEQAVGHFQDGGAEVLGVPTDVSDAGAIGRLRDSAFERFGTAHVLCNNAGIGDGQSVTEPIDMARWESVFGVNFYGVLYGVNAFLPRMLEQGAGHIVNTASRRPPPLARPRRLRTLEVRAGRILRNAADRTRSAQRWRGRHRAHS
jgi:NAD(P)-dependent dehydrogenase (short-subunit alcohol dehydrogenase family)